MASSAAVGPTIQPCISGLATYLPPRTLTNADLEKMVDTNDEWILQRTGIRKRHIVDPGVATSDLAAEAARAAIDAGGPDADRHRRHRRRHDHAGHDVPEHRLPAAAQDRRDPGVGLRPRRRLLRLHLRADDGGGLRERGHGQARAGGRRRRDVEHHRLHRPHHLRAVRRWRRRGGRVAVAGRRPRADRLHARSRRQRRPGVVHAGRRFEAAGLARDRRQAAALRPSGRAVGVPVRGAQERGSVPAAPGAQRHHGRRSRPVRVAPGQQADHRVGRATPRRAARRRWC